MVIGFVFATILCVRLVIRLRIFPIALGGIILISRLIISLILRVKFSVFSGVVLVLIFVGGLLVAFGYSISLASNPIFGIKEGEAAENIYIKFFFFPIFVFFSFFLFSFTEIRVISTSLIDLSFQGTLSSILATQEWGGIALFLVFLLLICIIGVVTICIKYKGALISFEIKR